MILVYQAYGRKDILQQVMFSVTSLFSMSPGSDIEILIYTDQEEYLRKFFGSEKRISLRPIGPEEIQKWAGSRNFVHRVKLEILVDASTKCSGDEAKLLYLDGDTVFAKDPRELFSLVSEKQTVMHEREFSLANPVGVLPKKIARFAADKIFETSLGEIKIDRTTEMWNAGVIGLHAKNFRILNEALALTDSLYEKYQKHVMEQLAVSVCAKRAASIVSASDWITHYWRDKEFFQKKIESHFEVFKGLEEARLNFPKQGELVPPPPKPKPSIFQRLFGTATKS